MKCAMIMKENQTYVAMMLYAPGPHLVHDLFGVMNDGLEAFIFNNIEIIICKDTTDLNDAVVIIIEPCHLFHALIQSLDSRTIKANALARTSQSTHTSGPQSIISKHYKILLVGMAVAGKKNGGSPSQLCFFHTKSKSSVKKS